MLRENKTLRSIQSIENPLSCTYLEVANKSEEDLKKTTPVYRNVLFFFRGTFLNDNLITYISSQYFAFPTSHILAALLNYVRSNYNYLSILKSHNLK